MGASYDITKPFIADDPKVDQMLEELYEYVRKMAGITTAAAGTYITYLNGLGGDAYIQYDPDTKVLSFFIEGVEHGRMNVT